MQAYAESSAALIRLPSSHVLPINSAVLPTETMMIIYEKSRATERKNTR